MPKKAKDMSLVKAVAKRLQELRKGSGMTLKDIAFEADMELTQVHRILHGSHDPQLTNVAKIAQALGTNMSDLFKGLH